MQQPSSYQRFYGYPLPQTLHTWRPGGPGPPNGYPAYQATQQQTRDASTQGDAVRSWTPYDSADPSFAGRRGNGGNNGGGQRVAQLKGQEWRGGYGNDRNQNQNRNQKGRNPRSAQPSPPAKRSRNGGAAGQVRYDERYIQQTYKPIDEKKYPQMTKIRREPKNYLWGTGAVKCTMFGKDMGNMFRATVLCKTLDGVEFEAHGDGSNKRNAERIACLHLFYKANEAGQLDEILSTDPSTKYSKEELKNEADALIDVYDYAARFDVVPKVTFRKHPIHKMLYEVIIEMPLHEIKATGRGKTIKLAEIIAGIEFKRMAEEYHAKNSEEDMVLKDPNALTSANAKKFLEYFKTLPGNRAVRFDVETRRPNGDKKIYGNSSEAIMLMNNEPIGEPVIMGTSKVAQNLAHLTAAVALKEQYPEIFPGFVEALKEGAGEILKPVPPIWLNPKPETVLAMTTTIRDFRRAGLKPIDLAKEEAEYRQQRGPPRHRLPEAVREMKSKVLKEEYEAYWQNPEIEELRRKRTELPMNKFAPKVIELVENNPTSIIVGATGSGKTTQVPQILLDEYIKRGEGANCNILCTQPRRIAATSVATRVAVERHEPLRKSVGYQVRFDAQLPQPGGSITYCTTGILLQQLRHSDEDALEGVTHLIIDEVHERDILIDFLLILLKRVIRQRREEGKPEIKVILMSATMDTELFAGYFSEIGEDGKANNTPSISVPGRTFPVQEYFLEDIMNELKNNYSNSQLFGLRDRDTQDYLSTEEKFPKAYEQALAQKRLDSGDEPLAIPAEEGVEDATIDWKAEITYGEDGEVVLSSEKEDALVPIKLMAATVSHIVNTSKDGAILCFLPGLAEIEQLETALLQEKPLGVDFNDSSKFKLYSLHSTIPTDKDLFEPIPDGVRKIIISTNIAETSVTIPDVQYVVDSGKLREKQYDQARRITRLLCTWISKSNSKQRAGRAGRVQNGNYYALYSKTRWSSFRATGLPEMLRSDLQEICLDIKSQGFTDPIADFLAEAIEPPKTSAVNASLQHLRNIGALDIDEDLTPLGKTLSLLPVEPALGKMILLSVLFRCFDPMIILGAGSCGRDIFLGLPDRKREINASKKRFAAGTDSDQIAMINAFREWRAVRDKQGMHAAFQFCDRNWLHRGALKTLDQTAKQIEDLLAEQGLIPRVNQRNRPNSEYGNAMVNENSDSYPLIKALIIAGQVPNIGLNIGGRGFRTAQENFTMVHPSSTNFTSRAANDIPFGTMVTFGSKARSNDGSAVYLRQTSMVTQVSAFLFGGDFYKKAEKMMIAKWIPFSSPMASARVLVDFRRALDLLLENAFNDLTQRRSDRKDIFLANDPTRELFARGLVEVLESDHPHIANAPPKRRTHTQSSGEAADSFLSMLSSRPASTAPVQRADPMSSLLQPSSNQRISAAELERKNMEQRRPGMVFRSGMNSGRSTPGAGGFQGGPGGYPVAQQPPQYQQRDNWRSQSRNSDRSQQSQQSQQGGRQQQGAWGAQQGQWDGGVRR